MTLAAIAPHHHPGEDLLLAYASGTADQATSLILATHLALCPICRAEVQRLEALGGALLEQQEAAALPSMLLDRVLDRLDAEPAAPIPLPTARRRADGKAPVLPEPLRSYIGGDVETIRWSRPMPGLLEADVPVVAKGARVRMMRIRGGTGMPQHTHHGNELTLVLSGGFSDETGHFLRGDLAVTDPSIDHRPVADDDGEDCICLAVTDAPLRFTGRFMRMLNPLLRW